MTLYGQHTVRMFIPWQQAALTANPVKAPSPWNASSSTQAGEERGNGRGSDGLLRIPGVYRVGSGSRGAGAGLISAVCLSPKVVSIPVKHCLRLKTQTKPITLPDGEDGLICFSIHLIAPFSFSPPRSFFCLQRESGVNRQRA